MKEVLTTSTIHCQSTKKVLRSSKSSPCYSQLLSKRLLNLVRQCLSCLVDLNLSFRRSRMSKILSTRWPKPWFMYQTKSYDELSSCLRIKTQPALDILKWVIFCLRILKTIQTRLERRKSRANFSKTCSNGSKRPSLGEWRGRLKMTTMVVRKKSMPRRRSQRRRKTIDQSTHFRRV